MVFPKVAIIGAGAVGSSIAFSILQKNLARVLLVDINEKRCKGEVLDLSDANSPIQMATTKEAGTADIIIITAGAAQKPGQTRAELFQINKKIITQIVNDMKPINRSAIIIVVANPCDALTYIVQQESELPRAQVFGSGTTLDSQRLRVGIASQIKIASPSVHVYVLGEHGDSQFAAWSCARIGSLPLSKFTSLTPEKLKEIADKTMHKAYEIIENKGATQWGIASIITQLCEAVLRHEKSIKPISWWVEEVGVCLSIPAVVGESGVISVLPILAELSSEERDLFLRSAAAIRNILQLPQVSLPIAK